MDLPSLHRAGAAAAHVARRFPLVVTSGLVAAGAGMVLIDSPIDEDPLERLLYVSTLGLPLFVGLTLLGERRRWSGTRRWLIHAGGVAALIALFFVRTALSEEVTALRYVQLSLGLHLFAAFAPYIRAGELSGFWQYNRTLFLRALTTAVFAGVLFAGLSGALAGIDNLLGVDVEGETYGRLWFFIAFVFGTWFFLGGVPEDLEELDTKTDYPAIIKVFSQFALVPIVTVYLAILTILVSGVAVVGILSLLLVHPIEDREENRWIRSYGRWFYLALMPSIVMLLLAIWQRIDQYGITEKRYFLVVLSLWLAGIALYFIFTRSRNIKVIPVTLSLVAFVTFAGPWGAYAVSRRNQTARMERLLAANDMLSDGLAQPATVPLSFEDRKELSAVIRYLAETHGTASIDALFGGRLAEIDTIEPGLGPSDRGDADRRAELMVGALDVDYVGRWASAAGERAFNYVATRSGAVISVAQYDLGLRNWGVTSDSVDVEGRWYAFELDEERSTIVMRRNGEILVDVPLDPVIQRAREYGISQVGSPEFPQDVLYTTAENERVRLAVYFRSLSGERIEDAEAGRYRITSLRADYYWSEQDDAPAP